MNIKITTDELEDRIMTLEEENEQLRRTCKSYIRDSSYEELMRKKTEEFIAEEGLWEQYIDWKERNQREHPTEWEISEEYSEESD